MLQKDNELNDKLAIKVDNLGKKYRTGQRKRSHDTLRDSLSLGLKKVFGRTDSDAAGSHGGPSEFWALRNVSFEVRPGEIVGIIGRNGAGKSTLLKTLARITDPTEGAIDIFGRVGSLLEVGTGFHQELTGRENVYLSGSILGMSRAEINKHFHDIVEFAEVEKFIDMPVKHYSSGMYLRLAFGVAAFLQPEILLIDEVLAVGDAEFQKKCLGKMGDVSRQGRTVLFVSHNLGAVQELCDRGILIEAGRIVFDGRASDCVSEYYSRMSFSTSQEVVPDRGRPLEVSGLRINESVDPVVESGKAFRVGMSIQGRRIRNPKIFFIIENVFGQSVVHTRIFSKQIGLEMLDGSYGLSLSVPALWLSPGIYSMYFKVIANSVEWEGRVNSERLMLEVRGEMEGTGKAILNPEVKWEIASLNELAPCSHMGTSSNGVGVVSALDGQL